MFVAAQYTGTGKNLCVTKYNVGDGYQAPNGIAPLIPSSVKNVSSAIPCAETLCCWNGVTSTVCGLSQGTSYYSGCNRTVCKEIKEAKSGNKKKRRHYDL